MRKANQILGESTKLVLDIFKAYAMLARKQFTERQYLLICSVLVGLLSATASILLKSFVYFLHEFVANLPVSQYGIFARAAMPLAGMFFTVLLIHRLWPGRFLKGLHPILRSIRKEGGKLPKSQMFNHIITSGLTVGFGGSAGLESPIVSTGAAIGSNFAEFNMLRLKERTLLLACGISAGVSAAFNAPIAGVLFAAEVFLIELSISAIIPVILASAAGALLSKIVLNESILLHFEMQEPFRSANLPFYLVLGVLTGFFSIWFLRVSHFMRLRLERFQNPLQRMFLAWLGLFALILLFPGFYGEGYATIKNMATFHTYKLFESSIAGNFMERRTWYFILAVLMAAFLKPVATSLTIHGGGNGGQFAPSLFIGAHLGFAFALACHKLGFITVSISNFTIVAMSGVLAGVFYAPMTGIFLIAELTGGYELMIPLMLVSALSYSIVRRFVPVSPEVFAKKSKEKKAEKSANSSIARLMESDYDAVLSGKSVEEFKHILKYSAHNTFPVVDQAGVLQGIIRFNHVKELLFSEKDLSHIPVERIMVKPQAVIDLQASMEDVLAKFDATLAYRLPVVQEGKYLGFITKSGLIRQLNGRIEFDAGTNAKPAE